jgi:hypothetical protein
MRAVPILLLALAACGGAQKPMAPFQTGAYQLAGAEYWPWVGDQEPAYPSEILWGFYPKQGVTEPGEDTPNPAPASPAAIRCAKKSYAALQQFLAGDPPALKEAVTRGADHGITPKFYLWTNDYQRATPTVVPRAARLWYWKRVEPDAKRPPGYWKWEATLDQNGECTVPSQPQIDEALEKVIEGVR